MIARDSMPRALLRTLLVLVGSLAYLSLFWVRAPASWPKWPFAVRHLLVEFVAGLSGWSNPWSWVATSVVLGGVLPAAGLLLLSRRGEASMIGAGNRFGWWMALGCYLIALLPVVWFARSEAMQTYVAQLGVDWYVTFARSGIVMVVEHVCIQGAVLRLALGRPARWPWLAIVTQAIAFAWIHIGKSAPEVVLSLPGGLAFGFLAWRSQSVWPCVALHAGTAATTYFAATFASTIVTH